MDCKDVEQAAARLSGNIHNVKVTSSKTFSAMSGCELFLKCENRQKTGSFKVRGAFNKLAKLKEEGYQGELIASSAGNHAQGVSYASAQLGMHATIVMPKSTPIAKVLATQGYGAEVVLAGDCYDECYQEALRIQKEREALFIHPFDDEDVIAGQGTIAYEICHDLPNVDMIVVPAGGGGLLSGIAFYAKQINPRIKVVGVQAEGANAIVQSFKKKKHVATKHVNTIADGIAVMNPGSKTNKLIQEYVDDMV
ncbi:MAG: threonine/serine dehydratase, partial [Longicatena sp.]